MSAEATIVEPGNLGGVAEPGQYAFPEPARLGSLDIFRLLPHTWPFIRPYKRHLLYLLMLMLPGLPAGLLALTMIRVFFDVVGHGQALTHSEALLLGLAPGASRELILWHACIATGIAALVLMPLSLVAFGYAVWILQRISNVFRVDLYARLQELSLRFHAEEKIGDAIFRMFQDSAAIPAVINGLVIEPLRLVPFALGGLVWLFMFDARIALIAVALIPANFALGWLFSAPLRRAFIAEREATARATTRIEETLASIKTVKAFGSEAPETGRYARDNWDAFIAARRARLMLAAYRVCANTIRGVANVAVIYLGARQVMIGGASGLGRAAVSLGLFQGALWAFGRTSADTRALTELWGSMQDVGVAISRVLEMLAKPSEERVTSGTRVPAPLARTLAFEHVSFGYDPRAPVLTAVDFAARAGELTAIAGASGSGKSTLVALVLRFFDPTAGRVILDGTDIREFDLAAWRGMLSVALQENPLFTATLRDNVAYGRPDASAAEIQTAVERAGLSDFVQSLSAGLDTMLGEKGAKLSAGQGQRIGLARALLRNAPILLLDEPTAALDSATEEAVIRGVREWANEQPGRRIAIVATHRRTTAAHADRIFRIAAGRVEPEMGVAPGAPGAREVRDA